MKTLARVVACAFVLMACDKASSDTKPEDPAAKNAPVASASATVAAATPVSIADGDLSTPADFEEVAETSITAANYKAELTKLEGDIGKE